MIGNTKVGKAMDNTDITTPEGELVIQVLAMPADTNPDGDIFGGWLLSQMDIAGAMLAKKRAQARVVTVGIKEMSFVKPVFVGDFLRCYCQVVKVGNTSIAIEVEAWAERNLLGELVKVTQGIFTYVAVDNNRKPISITK